jgi:hypothetical protein
LSCACCFLLVALSSVLLRSQTLLSSARSMNFSPSQPEKAADLLPLDLQVSIFITLACLVIPLILFLKPFGFLRTFVAWANLFLSRVCSRAKVEDEESCSQESAGGSLGQIPPIIEAPLAPCGQASCPVSLLAETCKDLRVMVVEGQVTPPSRNTQPLQEQCHSSASVLSEWKGVSASSRLEHSFDARSSAGADGANTARQSCSPGNNFIQDDTSSAWRARYSPAALGVHQRHERQRRNADTTRSPGFIFVADSASALDNGIHHDPRSPVRAKTLRCVDSDSEQNEKNFI